MINKEPQPSTPVWYRYIKRFGLPKDRDSEISSIERDSTVFVGWDGRVFALDADDGSYRWSCTLRRIGLGSKVSHQIEMIWQAGSLWATWNNRVFRLNPENGKIIEHHRM